MSLRASPLPSLRAEGVAIPAWQPRPPSTEIASSLPLLAMTQRTVRACSKLKVKDNSILRGVTYLSELHQPYGQKQTLIQLRIPNLVTVRKPWPCGQSWGWTTGRLNVTACGESIVIDHVVY